MIIDYEKLQIICARKCMSVWEIFQQAHISGRTWLRVKAGERVRPKTAGKLAAALKVDVSEILK